MHVTVAPAKIGAGYVSTDFGTEELHKIKSIATETKKESSEVRVRALFQLFGHGWVGRYGAAKAVCNQPSCSWC